jgi:uncharacterized protein YkwD
MRLACLILTLTGVGLGGCGLSPTASTHYPVVPGEVSASAAQQMISSYRAARGLGPLALDPALQRVAQAQAHSMARAGQISHGPQPFKTRLAAHGAGARAAAENVAAGYPTLERVIASWRRSPGHDANLLMPEARRMGIALAQAPDSRFKTYWALVVAE